MVMLQEREGRQLFKECFAYGDSIADSELFQSVGNPFMVNPGRRLRALMKNADER